MMKETCSKEHDYFIHEVLWHVEPARVEGYLMAVNKDYYLYKIDSIFMFDRFFLATDDLSFTNFIKCFGQLKGAEMARFFDFIDKVVKDIKGSKVSIAGFPNDFYGSVVAVDGEDVTVQFEFPVLKESLNIIFPYSEIMLQ